MFALIATAALLVAADLPPAASDDTQQAYQAARASAGRSPDDQVRLAYWCEAHGLTAERMRHLALAVLADPNHAAARGLLGLVSRRDRWLRPDAVADQVKADAPLAATLAEYDAKRSATAYTADGQWSLAQWADDRGLKDQARAHYTAVIRLDPKRDQAWRRLGYAKHDGHWLTEAEVATAKADTEAQKAADKKWKPLLEKWKAQLGRASQRAEAEANLLTVTDPRAVPSIGKVFGTSEADGPRAVQLLGQIDAPAASRALAYLAAFGSSPSTRRVATETLRNRDPREFANLLIPFLHKPIRYEVQPVNGPNSPGVLFVEGEKVNVKRLYEPKSLIQPNDLITTDRFGQPVIERQLASFSNYGRINTRNLDISTPGRMTAFQVGYQDSFSEWSSGFGNLAPPGPNIQSMTNNNLNKLLQEAAGNPGGIAAAVQNFATTRNTRPNQPTTLQADTRTLMDLTFPTGVNTRPTDVASETTAEYSLERAMAESRRSAIVSQLQLNQDIAQVEAQNRSIHEMNDRMVGILNEVTKANIPAEPSAWRSWWINLLGYAQVAGQTEQNPTFVEVIPSGYQPELLPTNVVQRTVAAIVTDCFGVGTLVQTMGGPRPIEQIKIGDMVLTQNTATGALGYQPVTVTHHNPPAPTYCVRLEGDTIVVNRFHRFWVARRGWVMARDLKPGDPVRTLGGVRSVDSVEEGKVELVYNLDIAEDADFFAGTSAALVHDNTLPDPRLVPFDLPDVKAIAGR